MKGAWMGNVLFHEWSARKKSEGTYMLLYLITIINVV